MRLFCEAVPGFTEIEVQCEDRAAKIRCAVMRWLDRNDFAVEDIISEYKSPSGWWIVRWRGGARKKDTPDA